MLEFLTFFGIGFGTYAVVNSCCKAKSSSPVKMFKENVQVLAYDFKVYKLRKEYAEKHALNYTTPFAFSCYDEKFKIETESMTQLDFLNKLNTLVQEIEYIASKIPEKNKTTEPLLSYVTVFNSLKEEIHQINPYTK